MTLKVAKCLETSNLSFSCFFVTCNVPFCAPHFQIELIEPIILELFDESLVGRKGIKRSYHLSEFFFCSVMHTNNLFKLCSNWSKCYIQCIMFCGQIAGLVICLFGSHKCMYACHLYFFFSNNQTYALCSTTIQSNFYHVIQVYIYDDNAVWEYRMSVLVWGLRGPPIYFYQVGESGSGVFGRCPLIQLLHETAAAAG